MSAEIPYPPVDNFIREIRESAQRVCQNQHISIDSAAIERILTSPRFEESFSKFSSFPGLSLPLKFASHLDELNVLSILALLNFGSSFEAALREQTRFGASNAIKALIFSMYITSNTTEGDLLSAKAMADMPSAKVAELMNVDVMVEKPHPQLVGVTVGEMGGPMHEFVKAVTGVLNDTGKVLLQLGYPNLGFFVVEALKEAGRNKDASDEDITGAFLDKLVRAIPAFRDSGIVDGEPVHIFNKALFLVNTIALKFGSISPPPFPIPSAKSLPAFADGILPSVLVHLGVIDISSSPKLAGTWSASEDLIGKFTQGKPKPLKVDLGNGLEVTTEQALILRAATIAAVDAFPEVASKLMESADESRKKLLANLSVPQVNSWMTSIAKDPLDYHNLPTLVHKETVSF